MDKAGVDTSLYKAHSVLRICYADEAGGHVPDADLGKGPRV